MGRGHAALMTPAYRKPMWDDDADNDGKSDGIIAAPSLATVIDIAANIVIAAVLPGGVGNVILGAALNLVDDFIFATADVATGYATADQAFGALGRKALTSAVRAGVSIGGGALDGVLGVAGTFGEVVSDIGIRGVQMLTTNAANSIIHNGFNGEALLDATFGQNALKGYAVGLVGAGVSSGMETAIVGTVGKALFNARALSGLAGGLASAGMEYGLTGKTKLNVLNMADLTGGKVHGGLLELNIDREGGSLFTVGQGGVEVSMHAFQNAAAGFDVYRNAARIRRRGFRDEQAIAMRMLRSLGRNETDRLFGDLMSGRTSLAREARLAARARTDRGEGDDKIITLGREANGESRFGLGITLVHEAFRDGEIRDDQAGEGERAVLGHVDAGEEVMNGYGKRALGAAQRREVQYIRFMQAMGYDAKISEYVKGKYDSSADYWKLKSDGSIEWDGKRGLYDEEGNLIRLAVDENGLTLGYGESLLEYMGRKNAEAFLKYQGSTTAEKMTNSELGDALMGYTPLNWTAAAGVPKDPNMADLLNNRTVGYRAARNSWVNTSYQYDSIRAKMLRTEFGTAAPKFTASKDVMKQVAMRNRILSGMAAYAHAVQGRYMSPGSLSRVAADIRQRQGEYNRTYVKSGLAFTPENYISQKFANKASRLALTNGSYLTYTHAGIDTVGSNRVVSPGFTERFAIPSRYERNHAIELSLIDTDINFRALHMNPDQMKTIAVGMQFNPGGFIGNYGKWGGITGPHLHLEATRLNGAGRRGFVNGATLGIDSWRPRSDFGGYYESKENDEYIKKNKWSEIWPR